MKAFSKYLFLFMFVFAVAALFSLNSAHAATPSSSSCLYPNAFSVVNAYWGVSSEQMQVGPGNQGVPLTVTLLNRGNCSAPIVNITLSNLPSGFSLSSTAQNFSSILNQVQPYSTFSVTFYLNILQNESLRDYYLPLTIQYSNSSQTNTQHLNATVPLLGQADVSLTPYSVLLTAGQVNYITVVFANTGSGDMSHISSTITSPQMTVIGQSNVTINNLLPDHSRIETFEVFVPSSFGGSSANLNFLTSYLDPYGQIVTSNQAINFIVQSFVKFELVTSSVLPTLVSVGTPFSVTLTITNVGFGTANNVEATPILPSGFTNLNGGSVSGGDIQAGSSATFTFTFMTNSSVKPGNYIIPINTSYLNSLESFVSSEIDVPVKISPINNSFYNSTSISKPYKNNSYGFIFILTMVVILIIIIVIVLLFLRKRSTKKKR
ncbi:hypothetical protein IG206_00105 [Candidatus Parvarchaeota archaeon]|nr:hypothetical protein [Candidatus Acidifodinimicrobium mancum]